MSMPMKKLLAPTMNIERNQIEQSLRTICIPTLKEHGFKGSFPNFYRNSNDFISLVNFQFFSSGGSLCVNLSFAGPKRENVFYKPDLPAKDLRVSNCKVQVRLGAPDLIGDKWFSFGATSYGELRGNPVPPDLLATEISGLLVSQAIPWWAEKAMECEG